MQQENDPCRDGTQWQTQRCRDAQQLRRPRTQSASAQPEQHIQHGELEYCFPKTLGLNMTLGTILLIVLILILVGVIPTWPHSSGWGYYPAGGVGTILVIVLILLLLGRL